MTKISIRPIKGRFSDRLFQALSKGEKKKQTQTKDKCQWCGMTYPRFSDNTLSHDYYEIELFGSDYHKICGDCYRALKKIKGSPKGY